MSDEVRIPVDLDTRGASAKLHDLDSKKTRANTRARSQIWGKMRARALQTVGTVSGYASIGALTRLHTGQANPWAEAMKPAEAAVQQFIDEGIGYSAIARQRARETTAAKLGLNVGLAPDTLPAAKEFFQTEVKITSQEEEGRNILRQALQGPTLDELIAQTIEGAGALIGQSFDYIHGLIRD